MNKIGERYSYLAAYGGYIRDDEGRYAYNGELIVYDPYRRIRPAEEGEGRRPLRDGGAPERAGGAGMSAEMDGTLANSVGLVMGFTDYLSEADAAVLKMEAKKIRKQIRKREAAFPVIVACGGTYTPEMDELKARCAELLAELVCVRAQMRREARREKAEAERNRTVLDKILG